MASSNGTEDGMRPDVIAMRTFGRVVSLFGVGIIAILFFCEVISIIERWSTLRRSEQRIALYSSATLAAVSVMGFWVELDGALLWWLDWTPLKEDCNNFMFVVTLVYVVMKQFTYLFLFERLKVVHNALNLDMWYLRLIRWVVFLSSTLGVAFIFYPMILVFFRGFVIPEGPCLQYTITPLPIILFAVSDVGLSSLMLALFVAPLTKHITNIIKVDETSQDRLLLMQVAKRNLIISSLMMSATVANLFFMVHSMLLVHPDGSDLEFGPLQLLHTVLAACDALATVCLCHLLTTAWIPRRLKQIMKNLFGSNVLTSTKSGDPPNADDRHLVVSSSRFNDKQVAPSNGTDM